MDFVTLPPKLPLTSLNYHVIVNPGGHIVLYVTHAQSQ